MKIAYSLSAVALILATGCSTTVVDTNRQIANIPTSTVINANDTAATIEIGEQIITGSGCASTFLKIFDSGDNKFLQVHGEGGSSPTDRAKASSGLTRH
jgi:hypothetical protein